MRTKTLNKIGQIPDVIFSQYVFPCGHGAATCSLHNSQREDKQIVIGRGRQCLAEDLQV